MSSNTSPHKAADGPTRGVRGLTAEAMIGFVNMAPMALALTDETLRLLAVSPRWLSEGGVDPAQAGGTLYDALPGVEAQVGSTVSECRLGETVCVEDVLIAHAGGGRSWLRMEFTRWGDEAGGGYLIQAQDTTHMVEVAKRAEHAEACVKLATQMAQISFFEMDYENKTYTRIGDEGVILDWTMTYEDVLEDIQLAILPEDRRKVDIAWLKAGAIDPLMPIQFEYRANRRDGKEVWVAAASQTTLDEHGEPLRIIGVQQNITERKSAEAALRLATAQAEEANRAKSEFLANMSHEIRTPMNGVIGMNALLMRSELSAEQRKYAEAVKVSADCLLGIINDILDISKLEAGKVELEEIDFSLATVVEDVVELLSPKAIEKSLEIASYLDDGARGAFRGDPTRLRQVVLNLLSNALKFTERGYVAVEVRSRPASPGRLGLRLEVQDTGIGLSDEAKGKMFQKFQQADGSITRKYGGTGLGLSICRQLVDLMGGEIGVADRAGGGTIFYVDVELPLSDVELNDRPKVVDGLRGVRVLVVDDIELNRSIFTRQLQAEGAVVVEAVDGHAGLAAVAAAQAAGEPFAIVLMDHMMPGMSGEAVARAIRSDAGLAQPKLVLASSIGTPNRSDPAAQAGFDAFLTKPVRHQALVTCLAGLVAEAAPEPALDAAPSATPAAPRGRGRVLLAEDNEINTMLACTILEEAGYSVDCVVNGLEAVEAVESMTFDLILMDVQMPVMDGLEATRRIRALGSSAARTPILAMTANAMATDRDACLEAGMDDFISKPIDPDTFLRVVVKVIPTAGEVPASTRAIVDVADLPDLDDAHLDSLARLLPPARLNLVIEGYLAAAEGRLHELEACARSLDLDALARQAHDLKGASGNFGARRLQGLAEQLELASKSGDGPVAQALVAEIRRASIIAWDLVGRRLAAGEKKSA
jgi:signal transduction histidine kinase/DNA-binding response OmpR family regulator/HPt (histidine-containing phosphotransfer) domain-containing protein